jgi:deazaflavin-dependent oxidoreductase (nitroreductase family)
MKRGDEVLNARWPQNLLGGGAATDRAASNGAERDQLTHPDPRNRLVWRSIVGISSMEAAAMADTTPSQPNPKGPRRSRQFRRSRGRRIGDAVISVFVRAGLVPSTYMLTTIGRKTGRSLTHPATVVQEGQRRWLVAPYGAVSWVHNARAAGRVRLVRRRDRGDYSVRELSAAEAGPVLKRYIAVAAATRPYFDADKDAPAEHFVAEAHRHPVFELLPISDTPPPADHGR